MREITKTNVSGIVAMLFIVACSNQTQLTSNESKFFTKAISNPTPTPSKVLSSSEMDAMINAKPPLNAPVLEKEISIFNKPEEEQEITFDNPAIDQIDENSTSITVIYHNKHKMRVKNGDKKVSSSISLNEIDKVNAVLDKYGVISHSSQSDAVCDSNKADDDEIRMSNTFKKSQIPNRQSIHYYDFPKGTDFKSLLKELRGFSTIRSVHIDGKIKSDLVFTLLSRNTPSGVGSSPIYQNTQPTDPLFSSTSESTDWWYFRRHRIFESWGLYGNTAKPRIAIIDSGFDTTSTEKPNYQGGFSVSVNSSGQTYETQGDLSDPTGHGTIVASVAGAPKDNAVGFSGVLPGVQILPIKIPLETSSVSLQNQEKCLARAIYLAANNSLVSVINISSSFNGIPLTGTASLKLEIMNAVSLGKIVVITAGNDEKDLNPFNIQSLPGVIVVGGSENDSSTNRSVVWKTNTMGDSNPNDGVGSNYGNIVDITAGARFKVASGIPGGNGINIGTSIAAPIISVAAGMVKVFSSSLYGTTLTPDQIKSILIGTSTLGGYNAGAGPAKSIKYYGKNLNNPAINVNGQSNIRDLNLFNSLIVAKNISQYDAITRVFNGDDYIQAAVGGNWQNYYEYEPYKNDTFYGINGLTTNSLNFKTYNTSGGYAYGYQVYKNKKLNNEVFDGLSGIIGAQNNSGMPSGVFAPYNF